MSALPGVLQTSTCSAITRAYRYWLCALSSLGGGKGYGRGAEGVGPSHRKEGNSELGKGFGAKAVTYWTGGEAAEEGEGNQAAGSKPGRGSDADRGRMGSERHSIREREEREERRTHGP